MSTAHSPVGPSGAARRIQCTFSVKAEQQFPEGEKGPEAAEGDAAHWALSELVSGREHAANVQAPNGVFITEEMLDGAWLVYEDIAAALRPYGLRPEQGMAEVTLAIPRVHPAAFGTPDYRIWIQAPGEPLTLLIYDYKFGRRIVDAFENRQIIDYVAGALEEVKHIQADDRAIRVVAKIAQPRAFNREGPIRTWRFTASDIRAHINVSSNAAHEALGENPRARVGPECRDCRARYACEAFQRAGMAAVDEAYRPHLTELPPAALGLELKILMAAADRIRARISGLQEQMEALERRGVAVPGWRIERKQGRLDWTIDAQQVAALGSMFGVNALRPPEPITPTQAIKAGVPREIVDRMATRPPAGVEFVPDDGSEARRVFG